MVIDARERQFRVQPIALPVVGVDVDRLLEEKRIAHGQRGNFDPLVSEKTFYRVQGILSGRVVAVGPHLRNRSEFPLRAFVRCDSCGRGLTASWSKSKTGKRYPYYHCRSGVCRTVNVSKTTLEGLFAEELERLQPTVEYMLLVKDVVIRETETSPYLVGRQNFGRISSLI